MKKGKENKKKELLEKVGLLNSGKATEPIKYSDFMIPLLCQKAAKASIGHVPSLNQDQKKKPTHHYCKKKDSTSLVKELMGQKKDDPHQFGMQSRRRTLENSGP